MTARRDDAAVLTAGGELAFEPEPASVNSVTTGERLDILANPICHAHYNATLAFLGGSVRLRRPTLVTIKDWSDGVVEAHLSDALLYGTGEDEAEALEDLRDNILDAWEHLRVLPESEMAKPAWRIWSALKALCEPAEPR